jgi:hypothetical protein
LPNGIGLHRAQDERSTRLRQASRFFWICRRSLSNKQRTFVLLLRRALCCSGQPDLSKIVSAVILCDLRVQMTRCC